MRKHRYSFRTAALFLLTLMIDLGCASAPMNFDPGVTEPQLIVDPPAIRLGVAKLLKDTQIVFKGRGFQPGDSVFISLLDVQKDGKSIHVPIADAVVAENGEFSTEVTNLVKTTELLLADLELNDEMEMVVVVPGPPIPAGEYAARAESMESDKTAQCKLTINGPSVGDSIKDWIGGLLGKIKKK